MAQGKKKKKAQGSRRMAQGKKKKKAQGSRRMAQGKKMKKAQGAGLKERPASFAPERKRSKEVAYGPPL
jgi:hypothetical protein